jgi:hypothetical protein
LREGWLATAIDRGDGDTTVSAPGTFLAIENYQGATRWY